jgi:ribonucleoside-diphosphate reductase alpha chain
MDNIEVPTTWSQLASDILISKYVRKAGILGDPNKSETSVKQVIGRIVDAIVTTGIKLNYFADSESATVFRDELTYILLHQYAAFNSPVWFNLGLSETHGVVGQGDTFAVYDEDLNPYPGFVAQKVSDSMARPQCSACFIQSVKDSLVGDGGIFDVLKNEAKLFKYGSGTGSNFSAIRGEKEKLSGGGTSSGLMSFLEVFDRAAGSTKSGGTTRRAAKMVCLDADHPEIVEFIEWKMKEEKKVQALIRSGYPSDFNGEAYHTVSGQNSNNSIRLTDEFFTALTNDGDWSTKYRTTGEVHKTYKARFIFDKIVESAWSCADPGIQYDTTINKWHTCKGSGRINASNPCSEYMFLDDTACNLASLNLVKFLRPGKEGQLEFDDAAYIATIKVIIVAQEILVAHSSYPTKAIAQNSHEYRPLGD